MSEWLALQLAAQAARGGRVVATDELSVTVELPDGSRSVYTCASEAAARALYDRVAELIRQERPT